MALFDMVNKSGGAAFISKAWQTFDQVRMLCLFQNSIKLVFSQLMVNFFNFSFELTICYTIRVIFDTTIFLNFVVEIVLVGFCHGFSLL